MAPIAEHATPSLAGPERVVVAPVAGVFEPVDTADGATIAAGQIVGHVRCGATRVAITSPFAGRARGMFAWPDERVRRFQPVLWMAGEAA